MYTPYTTSSEKKREIQQNIKKKLIEASLANEPKMKKKSPLRENYISMDKFQQQC